jgi:hypothetical protein
VQQIPAAVEKTDVRQAQVPCDLLHPVFVRRARDSRNAHLAGCHSHKR